MATWGDDQKYDGGWKDNMMHGYGYYTSQEGVGRNGQWKDGQLLKWVRQEGDPRFNDLIDNQYDDADTTQLLMFEQAKNKKMQEEV